MPIYDGLVIGTIVAGNLPGCGLVGGSHTTIGKYEVYEGVICDENILSFG